MKRSSAITRLALLVIGSLLIALGIVTRTTSAGFSDVTSNAGNSVGAGSLALSDDDSSSALFTTANTIDVGSSISRCINVTYTGLFVGENSGATVKLFGSLTGALDTYATLTIERGTGGTFGSCGGAFAADGAPLFTGTVNAFTTNFTNYATGAGAWIPVTSGETKTFKFTVAVPNDANAADKSVTGSFTWEAQHQIGGPGYRERVLQDTPVAYWRLSGGAGVIANEENRIYPGEYYGEPNLTSNGWTKDGDKKFVSVGNYDKVLIPNNSIFNPPQNQPFSIEYSVERVANRVNYPGIIYSGPSNSTNQGWAIFMGHSDNFTWFKRNNVEFHATTATPLGVKSYRAMTYDGNLTVRWYLNGVPDGVQTLASKYPDFAANAHEFQFAHGDFGEPNIKLDEVAFYTKELSASRIAHHYSALDLSTA